MIEKSAEESSKIDIREKKKKLDLKNQVILYQQPMPPPLASAPTRKKSTP